jgi:acyl-CoA thioester hydrolase
MDELLKGYPVVVDTPIAWGEMDAFQHVNNVVYFRYFENARIVYFDKLHVMSLKEKTGIGPIMASQQCKYKMQLLYPDTISVGTRIVHVQETQFTMQYVIVSQKMKKVAAEGECLIAYFDYNQNKRAPIPDETRELIQYYENGWPGQK